MGTNIRPEVSKNKEYWISRERYYELAHFCRQYKDWKKLYFEALTEGSAQISKINTDGIEWANPTAKAVEKADRYFQNYRMIEESAEETDSIFGKYILLSVTEGKSYAVIRALFDIPCGKDFFYKLYRRFFYILHLKRL